jgi:hypothetical protein
MEKADEGKIACGLLQRNQMYIMKRNKLFERSEFRRRSIISTVLKLINKEPLPVKPLSRYIVAIFRCAVGFRACVYGAVVPVWQTKQSHVCETNLPEIRREVITIVNASTPQINKFHAVISDQS